jgi:SAM-dependent methyltransferase
MNADHWNELFRAWSKLKTPRRVPDAVVAGVREQIERVPGPTLMLGITHGLSDLGSDLTALDRSEALIKTEWPGNTPNRRAVVGDWTRPPFAPGAFATCIGDGVINSLTYPEQATALLSSIALVLQTGGCFVCRVFTSPDEPETVAAVVRATWQRGITRFQTLKFRLAMAIASEQGSPNIAVQTTHRVFEQNFPDRGHLAAATGWERKEIDTIDIYATSPVSYTFPTRRQCEAIVPAEFVNARFVSAPNYELAERYPLLVAERR